MFNNKFVEILKLYRNAGYMFTNGENFSSNTNISEYFIDKHLDWNCWNNQNEPYKQLEIFNVLLKDLNNCDMTLLSNNENITIEFVLQHLDLKWAWYYLSCNESISFNGIINSLDLPWNWNKISCKKSITLDIIEPNLTLPWKWNYMSRNENITISFIEKYIDKDWNWESLSFCKYLTMQFIRKYINKKQWLYKYKIIYVNV